MRVCGQIIEYAEDIGGDDDDDDAAAVDGGAAVLPRRARGGPMEALRTWHQLRSLWGCAPLREAGVAARLRVALRRGAGGALRSLPALATDDEALEGATMYAGMFRTAAELALEREQQRSAKEG